MSTSDTSEFGKFVPGFDFLQNLAKSVSVGLPGGGAASGVSNLSQWLVPSLNVEDLEKRIEELKHVQFWLEQNSRALAATIQALEVQKLTMATLKSMNFTMGMPAAAAPAPKAEPVNAPPPAPEKAAEAAATAADEKPAAGVIDPLQLWGSLTQQFQTIAANAFKEVSDKVAAAPGGAKAGGKKTAPAAKTVAKKPVVTKPGAKKTPTKKAAGAPARRRSA
jgi:hypothetical protein